MHRFTRLLAPLLVSASFAMGAPETSMELTSADFSNGGTIPPRFTCDGAEDSPGLRIRGVPEAAKGLVLIMDDPDAPRGTFTHWLVWRISPDVTEFSTDSVPSGVVQGTNDAGKTGYKGPCPPSGQHRYYFRLYALDRQLDLPPTARRAEVATAIKGHVLAEATLLGRYGRSNAAPSP